MPILCHLLSLETATPEASAMQEPAVKADKPCQALPFQLPELLQKEKKMEAEWAELVSDISHSLMECGAHLLPFCPGQPSSTIWLV